MKVKLFFGMFFAFFVAFSTSFLAQAQESQHCYAHFCAPDTITYGGDAGVISFIEGQTINISEINPDNDSGIRINPPQKWELEPKTQIPQYAFFLVATRPYSKGGGVIVGVRYSGFYKPASVLFDFVELERFGFTSGEEFFLIPKEVFSPGKHLLTMSEGLETSRWTGFIVAHPIEVKMVVTAEIDGQKWTGHWLQVKPGTKVTVSWETLIPDQRFFVVRPRVTFNTLGFSELSGSFTFAAQSKIEFYFGVSRGSQTSSDTALITVE